MNTLPTDILLISAHGRYITDNDLLFQKIKVPYGTKLSFYSYSSHGQRAEGALHQILVTPPTQYILGGVTTTNYLLNKYELDRVSTYDKDEYIRLCLSDKTRI